jgi:hypothetical protein
MALIHWEVGEGVLADRRVAARGVCARTLSLKNQAMLLSFCWVCAVCPMRGSAAVVPRAPQSPAAARGTPGSRAAPTLSHTDHTDRRRRPGGARIKMRVTMSEGHAASPEIASSVAGMLAVVTSAERNPNGALSAAATSWGVTMAGASTRPGVAAGGAGGGMAGASTRPAVAACGAGGGAEDDD